MCPVAPQTLDARYMPREGVWTCPVPGCPFPGAKVPAGLFSHFAQRHPQHTVRVQGRAFPKCRLCGLQTMAAGTPRHERTAACKARAEQRRRREVAEGVAAAARRKFKAYDRDELRAVDTFKYLGRVITRDDCDAPAIRRNLKRARQVWGRLSKVIATEGVAPRVAGMFYQAVVAAVLLYGSETWCVSDGAR